MAYSNWGAFVYRNGKRMTDKEDVAAFDTDESKYPSAERIFFNIAKNRKKYGDKVPDYATSHHAVLGDDIVRLCGYKDYPVLFYIENGVIKEHKFSNEDYEKKITDEIIIDGKTWKYTANPYDGNMIDLELVEPDGTQWTSTCGYMYGAGFD